MKREKLESVCEKMCAFLGELRYAGDLPPVIRRKARELVLLYEKAAARGPGSNLKPGDHGRIVSFVDRMINDGKSVHQAAELAGAHFHVHARRIEQIYRKRNRRPI